MRVLRVAEVSSHPGSLHLDADDLPSVVEVSVVMPCLNEAETVGTCIQKAQAALRLAGIEGEIIVADNGSTDGSPEIARQLGARVVPVEARGYGHALMRGIEAARGTFIVMGDADDSYDFTEVPRFVERLREGASLVQGCRLPAGGGQVLPGAMPFLHRWLGNPMLSFLARKMFAVPVTDIYCGLRGFTRELYGKLGLRCTGMEFATEMIIKSSLLGEKISEVPITLHPDGRTVHPPHLRTFLDGWRTLRFFLLFCPEWVFFGPGVFLLLFGALGYALAGPGVSIRGVTFDAHTLLIASLALLLGFQAIVFAVISKTFAVREGVLLRDPWLVRLLRRFGLERGLLVGFTSTACGLVLLIAAVVRWSMVDFGRLDYAQTMRWVIPGVTLCAFGCQAILSSFLLGLIQLERR
jgi:hypothetical protein